MRTSILRRTTGAVLAGGLVLVGGATTASAHADTPTFNPTAMTIGVSPKTVAVGHLFVVGGTLVNSTNQTGAVGQPVVLYARPAGTSAWSVVDTLTTDGGGMFI